MSDCEWKSCLSLSNKHDFSSELFGKLLLCWQTPKQLETWDGSLAEATKGLNKKIGLLIEKMCTVKSLECKTMYFFILFFTPVINPWEHKSRKLQRKSENVNFALFFYEEMWPVVEVNHLWRLIEAVVQRVSVKKVLLEILQNSQENTCAKHLCQTLF